MTDRECVELLQWALPRLRMRWPGFRKVRGRVRKRLERRIHELGLDGVHAYQARLLSEPSEWAIIDALCRIPISCFYRDRSIFDAIQTAVVPLLVRDLRARERTTLRCWSAGCASGEEAYTLALLLRFAAEQVPFTIVATDVDEAMLSRALRGCYGERSLRALPRPWIDAGFVLSNEERCVRAEVQKAIEFRREDIREHMPDGPFDLVLCRNLVFTYFDEGLQAELLGRIEERVAPIAALVLGVHERLPAVSTAFVRTQPSLPIYCKRAGG